MQLCNYIFRWHAITTAPHDGLGRFTTSSHDFLAELSLIAEHFDVVPLRVLLARCGSHERSQRPMAALTFDDALACQAANALPLLHSRRLPYTLCIPTGSVTAARPIWNLLLRVCILKTIAPSLTCGWMCFDLPASRAVRDAVAAEIQDLLLAMPIAEWSRSLDDLFMQVADALDDAIQDETIRPMTWAQIKDLDPELCETASHSVLHRPALHSDSDDSLLLDASSSRDEICRRLGRRCSTYCFPFGIYTEKSVDAARNAGYETLLTSCALPVGAMSHCLEGRVDGAYVHTLTGS